MHLSIHLTYLHITTFVCALQPSGEILPYPALSVPYTTASHLYTGHLITAKQVTSDDAVKCAMQLNFKVEVCLCLRVFY